MRVIIAPSARIDLLAIGDFISRENPARAATFIAELNAACMQLAQNPMAYPLHPTLGEEIRVRFYRSYAIIYRIDPNRLSVVRVSHGARDLESLIIPDQEVE